MDKEVSWESLCPTNTRSYAGQVDCHQHNSPQQELNKQNTNERAHVHREDAMALNAT